MKNENYTRCNGYTAINRSSRLTRCNFLQTRFNIYYAMTQYSYSRLCKRIHVVNVMMSLR